MQTARYKSRPLHIYVSSSMRAAVHDLDVVEVELEAAADDVARALLPDDVIDEPVRQLVVVDLGSRTADQSVMNARTGPSTLPRHVSIGDVLN